MPTSILDASNLSECEIRDDADGAMAYLECPPGVNVSQEGADSLVQQYSYYADKAQEEARLFEAVHNLLLDLKEQHPDIAQGQLSETQFPNGDFRIIASQPDSMTTVDYSDRTKSVLLKHFGAEGLDCEQHYSYINGEFFEMTAKAFGTLGLD